MSRLGGKQPIKDGHAHEFREPDLLKVHGIRQVIARRMDFVMPGQGMIEQGFGFDPRNLFGSYDVSFG